MTCGVLSAYGVVLEFLLRHWTWITPTVIGVCVPLLVWIYLPFFWGAPWVPSPSRAIKRMLQMAELQPGQTLVDLGAGDGRIVTIAARTFKANAVGVEIDPIRCWMADLRILLMGVRGRARVHRGDMYAFDLTQADVVTMFLLQGTNQRLRGHLEQQLRPGAKVVSRSFSMDGWTPIAVDEERRIFVYEMQPAEAKAGSLSR